MSFIDDLLDSETLSGVRATALGYAQAANLMISTWYEGDVGEQIFEAVTQTAYHFVRTVAVITRGFISLDTSTDPGDADTFNPVNAALTPERGFLSFFGENTFGTVRAEATFASGTVTFTNAGSVARTFGPRGLVFTWSNNSPPDPPPTYRNSADDAVYTNQDGTVTVAAGSSIQFPVTADEIGTRSNATAGSLTLTTTLVGCTATNAASILGTDREAAGVYRTRCRQAPARTSLGGPNAIYAYLATKNLDGTPLLNASGNVVNINRVWVSQDSDTGIVDVFYADPSGAASAEDVTAANANIESYAFAVPDAITFTGAAATETLINALGTAKIKNRVGLGTNLEIRQAIATAVANAFPDFDIGGVDQDVDGNGVIYNVDLQAIAAAAYPGLYNVVITNPVGPTTSITAGHVATENQEADDWYVEIV